MNVVLQFLRNENQYYGMRNMSGRFCRENGLSTAVPGKGKDCKHPHRKQD